MKKLAIILFGAGLALSGCQEGGGGPDLTSKRTLGTLAGAALGGLAGAQFGSGTGQLAATAVGVLLGGLVGSEIGNSLDKADRAYADRANETAQSAPLGETVTWNNPDTGHRGTVTPVRDGTSDSGNYCREFQQTVTVGGKTEEAYGIACRQPDGAWKIIQQ